MSTTTHLSERPSTAIRNIHRAKAVDSTRTPARQVKRDWGEQHCVLYGIGWSTYERLLRELKDRPIFLTYDNGMLEIMAPSQQHGRDDTLLTRLISIYADECNIPIRSCGLVTIKRKDLLKGLEPDQCYYVMNERHVARNKLVDFKEYPPDLAIEVEISRRLAGRKEIYAALGIPEIWLDDGRTFRVLHLQANKTYMRADHSLNFPKLDLSSFEAHLRMWPDKSEYELVREFKSWLRKTNKR